MLLPLSQDLLQGILSEKLGVAHQLVGGPARLFPALAGGCCPRVLGAVLLLLLNSVLLLHVVLLLWG